MLDLQFAASLDSKPKEFLNLAKRPKAVAWIVSHCDTESDRESYVRELKNHIQVRQSPFKYMSDIRGLIQFNFVILSNRILILLRDII